MTDDMIELRQGPISALLARIYWKDPVEVEPGVYEMAPRRGMWWLRWLYHPRINP